MKLAITGDLHGDLTFKRIYQAKKLGYTHLIVCGDFGYIWDGSLKENKRLDYLNKIGVQILFCDGNHENHVLLNEYPILEMYEGKVHKIRDNVIHLIRGEIYNINNNSFWVFGGANSTDKEYRVEGKTWWKEEMPTRIEMEYGTSTLVGNDFKINYIITHTCYPKALGRVGGSYRVDELADYLGRISYLVDYKYWYFGHMHLDFNMYDLNTRCLYRDIVEIK